MRLSRLKILFQDLVVENFRFWASRSIGIIHFFGGVGTLLVVFWCTLFRLEIFSIICGV